MPTAPDLAPLRDLIAQAVREAVAPLQGEVERLRAELERRPLPSSEPAPAPDFSPVLEELAALRAEVADLHAREASGVEVAEAIREAIAEFEPTPQPRPASMADRLEGFLGGLFGRRR